MYVHWCAQPAYRGGEGFQYGVRATHEHGPPREASLTAFVAGDDSSAKASVLELVREIGFDVVDAGPLKNARLLEPLAYLNIQLGYMLKLGTQIRFKLLRS